MSKIGNDQKEYCANNIAAIMISSLRERFPDASYSKLISDFMVSETYELLYDFDTAMWAEGPGYVLSWYLEEKEMKYKKTTT